MTIDFYIKLIKMMCKSKHFFRDTEYYIYVSKNSVLIGKVLVFI